VKTLMPPAARGALFKKTAPLDPPQKYFIINKEGYGFQQGITLLKTITLFNKKFLEVSEPFFKKVLTRRRQL
jgi:hypothetical protein